MQPEELRKQLKKWAIITAFFALALAFYLLQWRAVLVAYVIVVGLLAVLSILIQSGHGGGLAASLGGLGGDSLLGTHSATPIAKATYVLLALFLFICVLTARMGAGEGSRWQTMSSPAVPAAPSAPAEGGGAGSTAQ